MLGVTLTSFLLIPRMGMNGLYTANILNGFICAAVIFFGAWTAIRHVPRKLEHILLLPEDFGVPDRERLDITVRNIDETMEVSRQVSSFCESRGIDARRSYFAGLCLEEMAGNVVLHGFTKDRKKHSLDIRVAHSGDDIILRLRDNCRSFNPFERIRSMESGDGVKNIGIRLVYSIAKDVQYQNLLGLNNLVIRI